MSEHLRDLTDLRAARDRVSDLGGYLREQRQYAKLSLRQLAALAGVSNPYLSQVERGLRKPSAEVLQQIARGLQISAEVLYVRAGFLDEAPSAGLEAEAAIAADPWLTSRQRAILLDLYRNFRDNASQAPAGSPQEAEQAARKKRTATTKTTIEKEKSS